MNYPKIFWLSVFIIKDAISLISFSACLSQLYNFPGRIFGVTYVSYNIIYREQKFDLFLSNVYPLDLLLLSYCPT